MPAGARAAVAPLRAVLLPALAAVLLHGLVVAVYVARHDRDPGSLVCVGRRHLGRPPFEAVRRAVGDGYDGQFYYAVARAPWRRHAGDIDTPARHLRILYPALCWLGSGGRGPLLLWVMPAVNVLAVGGIAGVGAWLACRRGMSAWWGFLLPLALDAGLPALRNLSDPVSTLALCGLLAAWLGRAGAWPLFLWSAAALAAREQNAAVVLILLGAGVGRGRLGTAALGAALGLWSAWVLLVWHGYGTWPFLKGSTQLAMPLSGLCYCAGHAVSPLGSRTGTAFHVLALAHLLLQLGLAGYAAARARERVLATLLLAGVLLALVAGVPIYEDFWSYGRVLVWLPLGLSLWALDERRRWVLLALLPSALSLYAALRGGII
jgi:hypothetical protein